jgi:HD-GYP domain-containing protein (c-di-GMP phosphodiesterase class II)
MAEHDSQEKLGHVLAQLNAAVTNTSLYSPTHPQVAQYIEKAHALLVDLLRTTPEITVLLIGDDLVADNRPLPSGSAYVSQFVRIMRKKSIERLTFIEGVPKSELQELIRDLASPEAVSVRSSPCIKLGKVELWIKTAGERQSGLSDSGTGGGAGEGDGPVDAAAAIHGVAQEVYQELLALTATELDELKEVYLSAKKHQKIDVRGVDEMVKGFVRGFRREINPLRLLASLKSVNEYTFTHVTNVCILTMSQAESVGLRGDQLHQVGVASLLHDIGKIFIPDEILSKAGALTPEERKTIETHTVKGARYLMGIEGIPKLAVLAALEHHQKYDGTGYPSIKGGWTPNITSQMISVADVFDAMRSRRSYQEPKPMEMIEGVLRKGSGTSFNPSLVDRFLNMIKR